jgi:hypothetical protein
MVMSDLDFDSLEIGDIFHYKDGSDLDCDFEILNITSGSYPIELAFHSDLPKYQWLRKGYMINASILRNWHLEGYITNITKKSFSRATKDFLLKANKLSFKEQLENA